jgi:hypothetical protein
MAKLIFDEVTKRHVEAGVSRCVLFPKDAEKAVAWNGITSITETSEGAEPTDLWADNIKYATIYSAETFSGTLEAYQFPEEFVPCDGKIEVLPGVRIGQQIRKPFDLCYRTEIFNANGTNIGHKLHFIFNVTASPSEKAFETKNDSPDAITFSWELATTPFVINGFRASASITIDSRKADRIKVDNIERIVYGSEEDDPVIPNPEELLSLIKRLEVMRIFMDILNVHEHWIWDTFNFRTDTVPQAIDSESQRHVYLNPEAGTAFIQPSIAYTYVSETDGVLRYSVYIIDERDSTSSQFKHDVEAHFSSPESEGTLNYISTTHVGNFYYYQYDLYI